ncbi:hypothetical protein NQ314_012399 [Rhamnusium bicolor]|uniref:Uncharacterized protein n=1 Tax=Rhamnusium bicolor TaxID=1586634 RepID=A0AAV8XD48_9CUCU|nr:hypothetical protein NQ314_012399 [Rhamnusium bicolor]
MNQAAFNWTPCILEIHGFTSCFLFSVETQHTTGYGQRTPTELCPEAIFLMCVQNIVGLIIEAFLVGIVFAKMTRPKLRTQTLQFSKYALICKRDGILCLLFRVGDMRKKSRIIEAKIKAQLIRPKKTKEDMLQQTFEIVVTLEGTIESTDQKTQARSSYLATEVLWGHTFEPMVSLDIEKQGFKIDYAKFDTIVTVDTPLCSAAALEFYKTKNSSKYIA